MIDLSKIIELLPTILNLFGQNKSPTKNEQEPLFQNNNQYQNLYTQNYNNSSNNTNYNLNTNNNSPTQNFSQTPNNPQSNNYIESSYWRLPYYKYAQNYSTTQMHNTQHNTQHTPKTTNNINPQPITNETKTEKQLDIMSVISTVSKLLEILPKTTNKKEEVYPPSSISNLVKTDNYNFN